jgi:hypothetical protein
MKTFVTLISQSVKRKLLVVMVPVLSVLAYSTFTYVNERREEEEREFEEREGIPGVLKQMDLWGEMRTYPNKEMDAKSFYRSFELSTAMLASQSSSPMSRNGMLAGSWTNLAPMNFAGRILSIGFHPTDPNIMWVGSASGGLWKTTNGGSGAADGINWQYVPTGFPVLGVSSIAVNPSNGNEIYIGTGEVYSSNVGGSTGAGYTRLFRGSYGIGILKSTDGGVTWTKTLDFSNSSLKGVMDLLIHPTVTSTVFAATTDGIYRTTNSGASWTLIHNVTHAMDMVFKPGNPDVLYVGSGNFQSANNGIYKTVNANAASPSFSKLTSAAFPNPISGKIQLAISANNPNRIYASIGRDPDQTSHVQGLYVSTNEGTTWAASGATSILGNQGWYAHDVAVSSANANLVLWGELDTYRSTNGGTSFTKTGSWNLWDVNNTSVGDLTEGQSNTTGYVHADVHRITASPHDATGNTFFLCTDGGLFRTTNGGSAFNTLNGGLNTAQIYANMAIHPTNANYMLLGLQDNEAMVYEGTAGSRRIGSLGDGFHAAMNSTGTIQIVESYYFNRRRSSNSGSTFGAGSGAVAELACFNVPMVFSRTSGSNFMYAGTIYLKRSSDGGSTWTNLNGGVAIAGANNPAIAMVAPNNNTVYFSTGPGGGVRNKLWRVTNASTASPVITEITGTLPDRYYSGIDVDPANANRLFVTLSGFGISHIYMSLDGGNTWSDLGNGLPDVPHNTVFVNPNAPSQVYVGNDLGVFVANGVPISGVLGATTNVTWINYSGGLGDATMASHIVMTNTGRLRLGTYGRGLWEANAASLILPITLKEFKGIPVSRGNQLSWIVADQSNGNRFEVEYSLDGRNFNRAGTVQVTNRSGEISYSFLHQIPVAQDAFYRLKMIDNDGSYIYSTVILVAAQRMITSASVYPNPARDQFTYKFTAMQEGMVHLKLFNVSGSLVLSEKRLVKRGANAINVNISILPSGSYRVVIDGNGNMSTATVIKQ